MVNKFFGSIFEVRKHHYNDWVILNFLFRSLPYIIGVVYPYPSQSNCYRCFREQGMATPSLFVKNAKTFLL